MGDNFLLSSSFMMLTEHLYEIFAQYIISGRTRAPPEWELTELIPTFQFGAKTDRRALQSKFKSWAKRMQYEDGKLILSCSGKIIVPKEKCVEIVMHFHSDEHNSLETVISKIKMKYSWTRKNFGMDRDVVAEIMAKTCSDEDCSRKIRMETAKCSNSFCSSLPNTMLPSASRHVPMFRFPPSLQCMAPPTPYRWPFPLQFAPVFAPNGVPMQIPYLHGVPNMTSTMNENLKTTNVPLTANNTKFDCLKSNLDGGSSLMEESVYSQLNINTREENKALKFKKAKNFRDYKILLKACEKNPKLFPESLASKKTKFLSNFALAPKNMCRSKTLKRFRAELQEKLFLNRGCMIYRDRKILRDRNKLIRTCKEKKSHLYLATPKRSEISQPGPSKHPRIMKGDFLKERRQIKRTGLTEPDSKEPVEVINIASSSSDDEVDKENIHMSDWKKPSIVQMEITHTSDARSPVSSYQKIQTTPEKDNSNANLNNSQIHDEVHVGVQAKGYCQNNGVPLYNPNALKDLQMNNCKWQTIVMGSDENSRQSILVPNSQQSTLNQNDEVNRELSLESHSDWNEHCTMEPNIESITQQSHLVANTESNEQFTAIPSTESNKQSLFAPNFECNGKSTVVSNVERNRQFKLMPNYRRNEQSTGVSNAERSRQFHIVTNAERNGKSTVVPNAKGGGDYKLEKNCEKNGSPKRKSPLMSSASREQNKFRVSYITKTHAGLRNITSFSKPINNYRLPAIIPISINQRSENQSFMPTKPTVTPKKGNTMTRIIYPIPISQSSPSNVIFVKKTQKGPFVIIPHFSRPTLPKVRPTFKPLLPETSAAETSAARPTTPESSKPPQQSLTNIPRTEIQSQDTVKKNFQRKNENKQKVDIQEEMMRITRWIYRMKSSLNPTMFQYGLEKSVKKMISQLNVGIYLVKEARKSLMEIDE